MFSLRLFLDKVEAHSIPTYSSVKGLEGSFSFEETREGTAHDSMWNLESHLSSLLLTYRGYIVTSQLKMVEKTSFQGEPLFYPRSLIIVSHAKIRIRDNEQSVVIPQTI